MTPRRAGIVASVLAGLSVACGASTRHRVLTFFFDGVPPLEAPIPVSAEGGPSRAASRVFHVTEHGPYAAKLCEGCHETGRGNALVVAPEQLCARCHRLDLTKKYVHGPLTSGGCVLCHDPHRSEFPYLLISDSGTFCLSCHDRRALRPVAGHERTDQTCIACHEAHMSDRPFLLR